MLKPHPTLKVRQRCTSATSSLSTQTYHTPHHSAEGDDATSFFSIPSNHDLAHVERGDGNFLDVDDVFCRGGQNDTLCPPSTSMMHHSQGSVIKRTPFRNTYQAWANQFAQASMARTSTVQPGDTHDIGLRERIRIRSTSLCNGNMPLPKAWSSPEPDMECSTMFDTSLTHIRRFRIPSKVSSCAGTQQLQQHQQQPLSADPTSERTHDGATLHHNHPLGDRLPQSAFLRHLESFCLAFACFAVGMGFAIVGPTLLAIEDHMGIGISEASVLLTCRALGGILGVLLVGATFERYNQHISLAIVLALGGVCMVLLPHCSTYVGMLFVIMFKGVFLSFVDCASNIMCFYIWGSQSSPFIQIMQLAFGLGATAAPLVALPFLGDLSHHDHRKKPYTTNITHRDLDATTSVPLFNHTSFTEKPLMYFETSTTNYQDVLNHTRIILNETTSSFLENISVSNELYETSTSFLPNLSAYQPQSLQAHMRNNYTWKHIIDEQNRQYRFPYTIVACFMLAASLFFVAMWITQCLPLVINKAARIQRPPRWGVNKRKIGHWTSIVILVCIFVFIHEGMEMTFQNLLFTYAVMVHGWTASNAAFLNSAFFFIYTVFRLVGAVLLSYVDSITILFVSVFIMIASYAVAFALSAMNPWILWVTVLSAALGMSSVVQAALTWLEYHIEVTMRVSVLIMFISSLGTEGLPVITGHVMETDGPKSFETIQLVAVVFNTLILIVMILLGMCIKSPQAKVPESHPCEFLDINYNLAKMEHDCELPNTIDINLNRSGIAHDVFSRPSRMSATPNVSTQYQFSSEDDNNLTPLDDDTLISTRSEISTCVVSERK